MKDEQHKAARPAETMNWSSPESYVDQRSADTQSADRQLAKEAEELLAEIDLANVTVSAMAGEVTLEGYAARLSDKTHAEEVVLDMDGVNAVRNNLRIAPERH